MKTCPSQVSATISVGESQAAEQAPKREARSATSPRFTLAFAAAIALVALGSPQRVMAAPTIAVAPGATSVPVNGTEKVHIEYDPDGSGQQLQGWYRTTGVSWSSNNTAVATISNSGATKGTITGKATGTATITGTYAGLQATATVTVSGTGGTYSFTTPDGRLRSYLLYVPGTYNPSTPAPLVIVYHGLYGQAENIREQTQFNEVARMNGFLVAYANGTGTFRSWNGGSCCGYAQSNDVDDVLFTSMLIDRIDINQAYNVDLDRVYAAGLSNGGIMAHRLACELSSEIAAIADYSGGLNLGGSFTACTPSRHVPVLKLHGTTDVNYPYAGGTGANLRSVPDTVTDWLSINNIPAGSMTVTYQNGIETCESYTSGADEVTLCRAAPSVPQSSGGVIYDGGGHAVAGGVRPSGSADVPTLDINGAAEIFAFFLGHPMP